MHTVSPQGALLARNGRDSLASISALLFVTLPEAVSGNADIAFINTRALRPAGFGSQPPIDLFGTAPNRSVPDG